MWNDISFLFVDKPVVILNVKQPLRIDEGQNINLSCLVDSNPSATKVHFEKDGCILNGSISTHYMEFFYTGRGNTGTYGCRAENGVGKGYKSVQVIVQCTYLLFWKYLLTAQKKDNNRKLKSIDALDKFIVVCW